MNIEKINNTNIKCFSCDKNTINSVIHLECCNIYLCDGCLKELINKSIEYLEV